MPVLTAHTGDRLTEAAAQQRHAVATARLRAEAAAARARREAEERLAAAAARFGQNSLETA